MHIDQSINIEKKVKNRGLKYRVPFSNAIEKNYMIQKKLKYQCPKC